MLPSWSRVIFLDIAEPEMLTSLPSRISFVAAQQVTGR
jgi:hypothetical protein